jgi:hypothetical protein
MRVKPQEQQCSNRMLAVQNRTSASVMPSAFMQMNTWKVLRLIANFERKDVPQKRRKRIRSAKCKKRRSVSY